ncbi:helix-turn-helix domain-containing protein [Pseudoscardovia radai]|uniref:helix-turn-helix domain-containing protein n=1 Tax=Pseudoscardovia radai TaxID=987066 RepID=UPI0039921F9F
MVYEFDGTKHGKLRDMQAARRTKYLDLDERIAIADMRRAGSGVRAIARALGRAPSTISRELRRNADDIGGAYGPHRAQQKATHRPKRPKPRKTLDRMKPSEKILELINDTATATPAGTMDTNKQRRRCDHH